MFAQLFDGRPWFLSSLLYLLLAALTLLLIWGAMALVGAKFRDFIHALKRERDDHLSGIVTPGALNWRCIRNLTVVGIVCLGVVEFHEVVSTIQSAFGTTRAQALTESANVYVFFSVIAVVTVISIVGVFLLNRYSGE